MTEYFYKVVKMKMTNEGVIYIMAHLIITLSILIGYTFLTSTGHEDETLKMALVTIIGYWFGAMGKDTISKLTTKKEGGKSE